MSVWPPTGPRRLAAWRHRGLLLALSSAAFAVVLVLSLLGLVLPTFTTP